MELAANLTLSHYRIVSKLGSGGMGEVYLAEDTKLDRKLALKLLPAEFTKDEDRIRRFIQEAKAASALNHPNIITIHEIGDVDGTQFIATEYIEGETLRRYLRCEKLMVLETLDVALQVGGALAAAHRAGIVHRDIKPENIMVRGDGLAKVLDFGLAKLTNQQAPSADTSAPTVAKMNTEPGVLLGTLDYMSPEQVRGKDLDARTDVFSFGVLVYEMVTGRAPFAGETTSDIIAAILKSDPPAIPECSPEAPAELQRIVSKALRKNRDDRYQTMADMLVDLKSLKQELEYEVKSRGAVAAQPSNPVAISTGGTATTTALKQEATDEQAAGRTTSSAEYIVSEIRQHKKAAVISLVVLLVICIAAYLLLRPSAPNEEGSPQPKTISSLAILPFANASGDPSNESLSDGISESLINNLSQLPELKVIARSSSFKYKGKEADPQEAAKALGVQAVVMGRIVELGNNLQIFVEVVNAVDKTQIWGEQYNRKAADLLQVQSEISRAIAEKLRLKLTGAERQQLVKRPTENLKAFQYYMQGRAYAQRRTQEDLLAAIRYYGRAIEEDGNYALPHAGLADAYANLGVRGYIVPSEGRRKLEESARQALALDENLAEAYDALGQADTVFAPSNFPMGDRELRRAIELSPSLASAHLHLGSSLMRQGRLDEALEEFLKARELDPLSSAIARTAAIPYYLKRDHVRALELLRQANELGPAFTTTLEIGVYIQNRLFTEALAELERAKRERQSDPILIYSTGMVYAAQGKQSEARQMIKELEEMSGASLSQAHWIAKIYAALNEKGLALKWLERGLAGGAIAAFNRDDPVWDPIRNNPRFADLLRRMGIPS
jgi:serine/threonine-protein kinase